MKFLFSENAKFAKISKLCWALTCYEWLHEYFTLGTAAAIDAHFNNLLNQFWTYTRKCFYIHDDPLFCIVYFLAKYIQHGFLDFEIYQGLITV